MKKNWIISFVAVLIVCACFGGCTVFGSETTSHTEIYPHTETATSPGGVAITFDDLFIDDWFAARDLFKKYNAHVTFFVSEFQFRNESQINKLKQLQSDGHEIAFHGTEHRNAADYLKNHSVQEYLDNEIIPGVNLMKKQGFNPVDFSYPYGVTNTSLTEPLQQYFLHTRGTESGSRFYQYGSNISQIYAVEIDDYPLKMTLNEIYDNISRAKREDKIVIFYGHQIVPTNSRFYHITYERLEKILKNVSENKMKFYTISELH